MIIRQNGDRYKKVFQTLVQCLRDRRHPYNKAWTPQPTVDNLPRDVVWGSVEHAVLLMCYCFFMRGGIRSDTAIRRLNWGFKSHQNLYSPKYIGTQPMEQVCQEVGDMLTEYSLHYMLKETPGHWHYNLTKVHRHYGGDPAKMFDGVTTFEQACAILMHQGRKPSLDTPQGFQGYREKMVSMLLYFLMDAEIIPKFVIPVPVDFHVLRVCLATECIIVEDQQPGQRLYPEKVAPIAREITTAFCDETGTRPDELADALWLLSGTLCRENPFNYVKKGKYKARKTVLTFANVTWTIEQVDAFRRSCSRCPVRLFCTGNWPSAPYYVRGELMKYKARTEPTDKQDFPLYVLPDDLPAAS
jgi:hypothetical protein